MSSSNSVYNIISTNSSCGGGSYSSNSSSNYGYYGGGCNHGGTTSFIVPSGSPVNYPVYVNGVYLGIVSQS